MNKQLRIAYCIPSLYYPSGMERALTLKANYFAEHFGYDIHIILTDGKGKEPYYPLHPSITLHQLSINYDEMYGRSLLKRISGYSKKQRLYKKRLNECLCEIRPDITVSLLRREINFICDMKDGMLNAVGLQNKGVHYFVEHIYPRIKDIRTNMIVNVSGSAIEDYVKTAEIINDLVNIPAIELNISCPNVKQGGMAFGVTAKGAEEVVKAVRSVYKKTLIVKLSPNVTDITEIARAAENGGADSVSLINTLLGMAVDAERKRPILSTVTGGMSGAAVKPIALRMVWQVAKAVKIPVIGLGGIMNWKDAVEFMLAGASAIQIGTANFIDPAITVKVAEGIDDYLNRHNYKSVKEIIGALEI